MCCSREPYSIVSTCLDLFVRFALGIIIILVLSVAQLHCAGADIALHNTSGGESDQGMLNASPYCGSHLNHLSVLGPSLDRE